MSEKPFTQIIADRRDGKKQSHVDLESVAIGAATGRIPDYQLSAWLMAEMFQPLDDDETTNLTLAMAHSGQILDLSKLPKPWVDKHSTGGVGDKTSLVLLPLLASLGVTVVKMSGRGLGITGGTVDKLSSIPGFRLDLSPAELIDQAERIRVAITGQTPDLAPADKVLYALRDATGTVSSIPLIVSSILSKKLAGGAETVVLDVKAGSGAFMSTPKEARALARELFSVGKRCGLNLRVAVTDMEQPLGSAVGNALEVKEAIRVVSGVELTPEEQRFRCLCVHLCGLTLHACGLAPNQESGETAAAEAVHSGAALSKMREWFSAQGATEDPIRDPAALPAAPIQRDAPSPISGWIAAVDAETVGSVVVGLGGGRVRKEDSVDLGVGVQMNCQIGSRVEAGQPLFTVHANSTPDAESAIESILAGIRLSNDPVSPPPLVLDEF